jgi:hypothetical protein
MVTCPYCKQRAMTIWGKLRLGPATSVKCLSCGRRVSVSWWAFFALFIALFAAYRAVGPQPGVLVFVVIAVVSSLFLAAYCYLVPVVGRENDA